MGCCSGVGRVVLIILNLLFLLISLAIIAFGVILKFFASAIAKILGYVSDSQSSDPSFHIPDIKDASQLPFLDDIGLALIIFGCILCCISFFACCGACCQWRPLLILFIILMSVLLIAQATVGGLFLDKKSVLHGKIKTTVGDKVKNDFQYNGTDAFDYSINMLQYLLGCCGIRGWEDYEGKHKPPTCCNRTIIDGDSRWNAQKQQCTSSPPTAPPNYYNPYGCYGLLQDKVLADLVAVAVVFAIVLLIQLVEIIFACLIVKDVSDGGKIGPI